MSIEEVALTAHRVMPGRHPGNRFAMNAAHDLQERFGIAPLALQVEIAEGVGGDADRLAAVATASFCRSLIYAVFIDTRANARLG